MLPVRTVSFHFQQCFHCLTPIALSEPANFSFYFGLSYGVVAVRSLPVDFLNLSPSRAAGNVPFTETDRSLQICLITVTPPNHHLTSVSSLSLSSPAVYFKSICSMNWLWYTLHPQPYSTYWCYYGVPRLITTHILYLHSASLYLVLAEFVAWFRWFSNIVVGRQGLSADASISCNKLSLIKW